MTVTTVVPARGSATLTITAEYRSTVEQVWQLWADPRLLERWWGPPTHPANVREHDLTAGGRVAYAMTAPGGDSHFGWWRVTAVDAPTSLEFDDGFGEVEGDDDLPVTHVRVSIADAGAGLTRMTITSTFQSPEAMDQLLAMGMQEGLTQAVGQTDELLVARAQQS